MKYFCKKDKILLRTIILMVVLYAWITLLATIFGIFYSVVIWPSWLLLCIFLYYKKIISFPKPSKKLSIYLFTSVIFVLLIALFTVPTIFSGRDQGSLSEAAMRLSQEHSLIQHTPESDTFFEINERGKALNFPGFFYTANGGLITQFPLPYISFIGGFFGLFGINGLIIANSILLFTFILSITAVARYYMSHRYTLIFMIIFLSSFCIGWFAKFTLSENIASTLLWSSLFLYILLKKSRDTITFFTFFLTISLLLFTRIEGIWFFAIFIFLIYKNIPIKTFIKKDLWHRMVFPATLLFVVACAVFIMNIPFITTIAKTFVSSPSSNSISITFFEKTTYLFSVYAIYGLLLPLIITITACITSIFYKRYRTLMLPIIIVLPLMFYYLFPHISGDHPWMLRRFVFALLPVTILISVAFVSYIRPLTKFRRIAKYLILSLLLFTNLFSFFAFITYAENSTLHKQITQLSQSFGDNDLILVDKNAAGNGWSMITNPLRLENKHAVYFFNPVDFDKLNTNNFDHVYLITSNENKNMYTGTLSPQMNYVKKYTLVVDQLKIKKSKTLPPKFPKKETLIVRGVIYELIKK